jgi:hypothetical protein
MAVECVQALYPRRTGFRLRRTSPVRAEAAAICRKPNVMALGRRSAGGRLPFAST